MKASMLEKGQKLTAVFGPDSPDGVAGGRVGFGNVDEIVVDHCAGPMGFYEVAVIRVSGAPDVVLPLHMAETFTLMGENTESGAGVA